ncbi:MAG: hypothetical protein AUK47_19050 [Deltaproteobacteria bacterium CG2_30_63_29]|nr:MAG: hypothetical protein AUK47_19050 [Deltaproteobacteria bacterium CG2_30_63_29]PJB46962.1 MAG: TlpA family protein disulfide reductase [Deltaproteobacteria bacterium CG_4_9_14_3_um_filter_63_12]
MFEKLVVSLVLAASLWSAPASAEEPSDAGARKAAQAFDADQLDGELFEFESTEGKVVVMSFWASWCAPCLQELPHLDRMATDYAEQGLIVLAVNTDGPETLSGVRSIVNRKKWTMPVLLDSEGAIANLYNPRGTNPFIVFVDRNGQIVSSHEGYAPGDEAEHEALIKRLLAE